MSEEYIKLNEKPIPATICSRALKILEKNNIDCTYGYATKPLKSRRFFIYTRNNRKASKLLKEKGVL